jgi:hypothetical protein
LLRHLESSQHLRWWRPDPVPTGHELAPTPAEYNDPFNHRHLRGEIGCRPPTAVENESLSRSTPAITSKE